MVALDKDRLARLADNSEIARRWPSLSEELKRKNAIADNFVSWLSMQPFNDVLTHLERLLALESQDKITIPNGHHFAALMALRCRIAFVRALRQHQQKRERQMLTISTPLPRP